MLRGDLAVVRANRIPNEVGAETDLNLSLTLSACSPPPSLRRPRWRASLGKRAADVTSYPGHGTLDQVTTKYNTNSQQNESLPDILFPEHWLFLYFLFGTSGHLGEDEKKAAINSLGLFLLFFFFCRHLQSNSSQS